MACGSVTLPTLLVQGFSENFRVFRDGLPWKIVCAAGSANGCRETGGRASAIPGGGLFAGPSEALPGLEAAPAPPPVPRLPSDPTARSPRWCDGNQCRSSPQGGPRRSSRRGCRVRPASRSRPSSSPLRDMAQPVERALKDHTGSDMVDHRGPLGAAGVGF